MLVFDGMADSELARLATLAPACSSGEENNKRQFITPTYHIQKSNIAELHKRHADTTHSG